MGRFDEALNVVGKKTHTHLSSACGFFGPDSQQEVKSPVAIVNR